MYVVMAILKSSIVWRLFEYTESGAQRLCECLLTKWKVVTTNYKFKIADSYHKCNQIPNDSTECALNNFLTHFCYTSFLHSLSACRLMASLCDNGFVTSFSVDRIKRQFSLFSSQLFSVVDRLEKLLSASRFSLFNVMQICRIVVNYWKPVTILCQIRAVSCLAFQAVVRTDLS